MSFSGCSIVVQRNSGMSVTGLTPLGWPGPLRHWPSGDIPRSAVEPDGMWFGGQLDADVGRGHVLVAVRSLRTLTFKIVTLAIDSMANWLGMVQGPWMVG